MPQPPLFVRFQGLLSFLERCFVLPFSAAAPGPDRYRTRLLTIYLLIMILAVVVEQWLAGNIPLWAVVLLVITYILSRTRYNNPAAAIMIVTLCIPSYVRLLSIPNPTVNAATTILIWLMFPLVMTGILFPVRWLILTAGLNIGAIALLPLIRPELTLQTVSGGLGATVILALLLFSLVQYRNRIERERQAVLRASSERAQRETRRTQLLAELSQHLAAASRNYDQVMDIIVRQVATFIGDGASVRMLAPDGETLELAAVHNRNPEQVRIFRAMLDASTQRVSEGMIAQVFRTGAGVFIPVVDQAALLRSVKPEHRPFIEQLSYHSLILCPLRAQGRIMGVLGMARHTPDHPYTEEDFQLLQNLADRAALAIMNARLYADLQNELAERRRIEQEREALITELEARNAELERFTYTVSHDLKSPLVTIGSFLGFLEQDALNGNTAQVKADIRRIGEATERMRGLLDDLLELSRVGRLINPPQPVAMADIVATALNLVHGQLQQRGVQVEVALDLPVVYGDRTRLVEVIQNLVDNAAKFMGDQQHPKVWIGVRREYTDPVLFVQDNGLGIAPEYHQRIFGLFDKLDRKSEGSGVGLALVKRIIDVHGGRIWVESQGLGHGAVFCFTLPGLPESSAAMRQS